MEAEEILSRTATVMMIHHPFFGALWCGLNKIESTAVPTMGVNQENIVYNPEFLEKLEKQYRVPILTHEMLHIAFSHFARRNERDAHVWNIACDFAVNAIIKNEIRAPLPNDCLYSDHFWRFCGTAFY